MSNRLPSSKQNLVARRVLRWWKSEESAIFQWSNKLQTVLKFSLCFPVECFSKHPQKRRDILNTTTLHFFMHFFFVKITWFCIPLWLRYHVWIRCNASPPCVINMKIFSHVWNSKEKNIIEVPWLVLFLYNITSIQNSFVECTMRASMNQRTSKQ